MEKQKNKDEIMEASQGESDSDAGRLNVNTAIPSFSEDEVKVLSERLGNEETFKEAVQVLISWLESGQCNERNSAHFYSLIQLCRNNIDKLESERKESREVLESLKNEIGCIQLKLNEIGRIFELIENKNIGGNFTCNQIEKIDEMRTDILDLKKNILDVSVGIEVEGKSTATDDKQQKKSIASQCDLDPVYQNEMHVLALVSVILVEYPDGANLDLIYSRLKSNDKISITSARELEEIMRRCPSVFTETSSTEAIQEKKWNLCNKLSRNIKDFQLPSS